MSETILIIIAIIIALFLLGRLIIISTNIGDKKNEVVEDDRVCGYLDSMGIFWTTTEARDQSNIRFEIRRLEGEMLSLLINAYYDYSKRVNNNNVYDSWKEFEIFLNSPEGKKFSIQYLEKRLILQDLKKQLK